MLALEVDGYTSKEELHGFYLWNTVARNETGIIGSLSNGDEQKKKTIGLSPMQAIPTFIFLPHSYERSL